MVEIRRDIHRHPELGFEERRTAAIVAADLRRLGLEVTEGVARTGVVGLLRGSRPGPTVLVRADMDALPLQERNQTSYVSQTPHVMHACGHDGHVAMGLGTARWMAAHRDHLAGSVKFVFQPAEEGPGGALPMIEAENPRVDVALGIHLWNPLPLGQIGVTDGPTMACADHFDLDIIGVGGHGAQPDRTVDPIVVSAHVITALQTIASRHVDPLESVVVTIGAIHAGKAGNVIPERVELKGTVRAMVPEVRERLEPLMRKVIGGICDGFGARYDLRFDHGYPATINDHAVAAMVRECASQVLGNAGRTVSPRTMGGEDMSYFLNEVPGCFFFMGCNNPERGLIHPHHSPLFDFDEDVLALGVEMMVRAVEAALAGRHREMAAAGRS
jgi:amidohydrolase